MAGEYDDETELRRVESRRPLRNLPELGWSDEEGAHKVLITERTTLQKAALWFISRRCASSCVTT